MKKRYLKTVEDVLALKDTNTKIYVDDEDGYYKFVNGVLCAFDDKDNSWSVCSTLYGPAEIYIIEEEPMQEATADDVGKLCLFWNVDGVYYIGTLKSIDVKSKKRFYLLDIGYYEHCHKLSPSEVAELTGYKVEEAE